MATNSSDLPKTRSVTSNLDELFLGNVYDATVVRRLLSYVYVYRSTFFVALIGVIFYIAAVVAQPLIIAWGIDGFIAPDPGETRWGNLRTVSLIFLFDVLVMGISQYIQFRALARLSTRLLFDLRRDMFNHLQGQSATFFERNEVGRLMSRVQNDVLALQEFTEISVPTLADILMLAVIAVTLFVTDFNLALVAVGPIPLMVITMAIWQRKAKPTFLRIRTAISSVNGNLQEGITGVRVTQSMNRQNRNLRKFDTLNTEHRDAAIKGGFLSGMLMPPIEVISMASVALVVVVGGQQVLNGTLELGILTAFILYLLRFFEPIRAMTMQFTQFQKAMASGARIFELLDIEPDLVDAPDAKQMPPINGKIEFKNVSFEYVPGLPVLNDISLTIEPGESVAFVGLTGAGKTTLVSLVQRLYDVTSGQVLIDGVDVRSVTRASLAGQMSSVLQEPFLYSEAVSANIKFNHVNVSEKSVINSATAVGAHDFISKLPTGYSSILEQRGANLSMGQRALVSMARAIVADPRILILDEATANMDSETEYQLQEALKEVLHGRTSLLIAHRLSTITSADKIVVLEHGKIVEVGKHEQLIANKSVYSKLYAMNFGEPIR
ncbi:MAG: multidrug ABC transporter [Dehalococcoidia bacterium]|nr:multidrug ABC transporter [Dehalococcoidia bacterium]